MKFIIFLAVLFIVFCFLKKKKSQAVPKVEDELTHPLLAENVPFYKRLNIDEQIQFRNRVAHFLNTTIITSVGKVQLSVLDKLYVASSAIIPIFYFKDWAYNNLNEVLIYAEYFAKDFDPEGHEKNVMGMVGDGAMHRMMILSLPALRAGFEQSGKGNTGIHEFVHLLDKADGAVDGLPEYMIPKELVNPWIKYAKQAIEEIKNSDSDINPYGATNAAEFFAVISEYFFQKPQLLEKEHPEIYALLEKIYKTNVPS